MTLYDLFDLCNYISGKFPNGTAIPPERFNRLLPLVQDEFYFDRLNVKDWDALRPFRKTIGDGDTGVVLANGAAMLPDDYQVMESLYYRRASGIVRVNVLSDREYDKMYAHHIEYPTLDYPIAKTQGDLLIVRPLGVQHLVMSYLTRPTEPYMDYCVDADNPSRVLFMPTGSQLVLTATPGVFNLMGDDPEHGVMYTIATNVMKDGATDGQYSNTSELRWAPMYHFKLVYMLLSKIGLNLTEAMVVQYADKKEQEDRS